MRIIEKIKAISSNRRRRQARNAPDSDGNGDANPNDSADGFFYSFEFFPPKVSRSRVEFEVSPFFSRVPYLFYPRVCLSFVFLSFCRLRED